MNLHCGVCFYAGVATSLFKITAMVVVQWGGGGSFFFGSNASNIQPPVLVCQGQIHNGDCGILGKLLLFFYMMLTPTIQNQMLIMAGT